MDKERVDFRTPRERRLDRESEIIARRFAELMEYSPSANRAIIRIADEMRSNRETIRHRLVRCGAYIPGKRAGRNNDNQVVK